MSDNKLEFIVSSGTIFDTPYHLIFLYSFVYGNDFIEKWARQTFGDHVVHDNMSNKTPAPKQRWYLRNNELWLRDDADLTLFLLRWG